MKSFSDIQTELQAALDAENADSASHVAAITQAIADLEALAASEGGTVAGPKLVSLTANYDDESTVVCPVPAV